jgi:hypothetical protein
MDLMFGDFALNLPGYALRYLIPIQATRCFGFAHTKAKDPELA